MSKWLFSTALLIGGCLLTAAADQNDSITDFFKKTLSSPPDVEHFVGKRTRLRERATREGNTNKQVRELSKPIEYFRGARSGKNFFLRRLVSTNASAPLSDGPRVGGRSGEQSYYFNLNTLTYTQEPEEVRDPLKDFTGGFYAFLCQFLNMGLPDIRHDTIVWNGNTLTGQRSDGIPFYGELHFSNGLPATLEIRASKADLPYKSYDYVYPDPPLSLDGFPARITFLGLFDDTLQPWMELSLIEVKIAKKRLAESFFDERQFRSTNHTFVHLYTNGILYEVQKDGSLRSIYGARIASPQKSGGSLIFYLIIAGLAAAPLFLWRYRNKQIKTNI